jgi:hypothetical protein
MYFEQCYASVLCQSPQFDFYAQFLSMPSQGTMGCTVTTAGQCSYYACPSTSSNPPGLAAGTLTLTGGNISAPVTVTPGSPGNVYDYTSNSMLFTAGQSLNVVASGSTVPAFGPVSVVAPPLVSLADPPSPYAISTASDLTVKWTGGQPGATMIFEGASAGTSSGQSYFTCEWDASAGYGTVPKAVLAPMAGQATAYLVYGQYAATSFTAGTYPVLLAALPYTGAMASFH